MLSRVTAHQSVLLEELVELLKPKRGGLYIDGTLGNGGHAHAVLERIGGDGRLLGIDRDAEALARARETLARYVPRCTLVHGRFAQMDVIARARGFDHVDGIVLDIGVSSEQLGTAERGFSFMMEGPLDMRMDPSAGSTAADLVGDCSADELADLFRRYGEERHAVRIARAIVSQRDERPITSTRALADLVSRVSGGRSGKIHPATRVFQALRIAVNDELGELDAGLDAGLQLLAPGGRFAVITFHSIEDRQVKRFFARHAGRWESLPQGGRTWRGEQPEVAWVNRKVIRPRDAEVSRNPRARSAKLRVVERK